MAERRCFTKKITESDAFLDMPLSTQCLYFHLNMEADDDGFVNNPKKIARTIGSSEDDLKLLIAKSFVLVFDSGIIVIKHWRMHNSLQNDRYHKTTYQDEFAQLSIKDNKSYTLDTKCIQNGNNLDTSCIQVGYSLETEHNITKHNITKHNINKHFAPSSEEEEAAVAKLPLNVNSTFYYVYQEDVEHYKSLYPAIDVMQEFRNMQGWLESNPSNRKTKTGINRFISNWLSKSQNKTRAYSQQNKGGVIFLETE